jgi:hypothetical protein
VVFRTKVVTSIPYLSDLFTILLEPLILVFSSLVEIGRITFCGISLRCFIQ